MGTWGEAEGEVTWGEAKRIAYIGKISSICSAVLTQLASVTDRQTNTIAIYRHLPACISMCVAR